MKVIKASQPGQPDTKQLDWAKNFLTLSTKDQLLFMLSKLDFFSEAQIMNKLSQLYDEYDLSMEQEEQLMNAINPTGDTNFKALKRVILSL